jgi:hypothetical protein
MTIRDHLGRLTNPVRLAGFEKLSDGCNDLSRREWLAQKMLFGTPWDTHHLHGAGYNG